MHGHVRNILASREPRDRPSRAYTLGLGIIGGIGIGTFWIQLSHIGIHSGNLILLFLETLIPISLSTLLLGIGLWIHGRQFEEVVLRIGGWCLVGAVALFAMSVVSITQQYLHGVVMVNPLSVVTNQVIIGAILGAFIGIYDGQRHKRGRALRAERERAQQLSKRLTVLARVLRHDIRNAVNVILGKTSHIQNGTTDLTRAVATIDTKACELHKMSERARQLEQLLEGDSMQTTTIDIVPILQSKKIKFIDNNPGIEIDTQMPASAHVRSVSLIEEALDELLENAIEHNDTDTPHVEVTVSLSGTDNSNGSAVVIRIVDNGPGIPENQIRVLERGRETDIQHLDGLGLWFVYWVVETSDGDIRFEANDPHGSVIELRLPQASDTDTDETQILSNPI